MKRAKWINYIIIIILFTGYFFVIKTKNRINNKSEFADKAFNQICILYKKRDSLAKKYFPDATELRKINIPDIQARQSFSRRKNESSVFNLVKENMHFQEKLDSIIKMESFQENLNQINRLKLENNAKEIRRLKKIYYEHAKDYNTFIKQFPRNYYANILNFEPKVYYEMD